LVQEYYSRLAAKQELGRGTKNVLVESWREDGMSSLPSKRVKVGVELKSRRGSGGGFGRRRQNSRCTLYGRGREGKDGRGTLGGRQGERGTG